mgnify:CR=1 FL=1
MFHTLSVQFASAGSFQTRNAPLSAFLALALSVAGLNACGSGSSGEDVTAAPGDTPAPNLTATPNANDDAARTNEDTAVLIGVLANDDFGADGAGNPALAIISGPANGAAAVNDRGTPADSSDDQISYTPAADFDGTDRLEYRITDADGDSASAAIEITVDPVTTLAVTVTFPPPGSNLGGVGAVAVSGQVEDTDDGRVDPGDVSFVDVGGFRATQQPDALDTWSATAVDVSGQDAPQFDVSALSNSGASANASLSVQNELPLASPVGVALDAAGNRALVTDFVLDTVFAVDLATGERSVFSGEARGTGTRFRSPESIAIDNAGTRAVVTDRFARAVYEVDITSGNRRLISDSTIGEGPTLEFPVDAALDEGRNAAFVLDVPRTGEPTIIAVDLNTGNRLTVGGSLAPVFGPQLQNPSGIALDAGRDRLLVADRGIPGLMSVDLPFGIRSILSSGTAGAGPEFRRPSHIVIDQVQDRALVVDESHPALFSVDLVSGVRRVISDAAMGSGPMFSDPQRVALDTTGGRLLMVERSLAGLLSIDLESGDRSIVTLDAVADGPQFRAAFSLAVDPTRDRALVVDSFLRAVFAVDLVTGERTVVSDDSTGAGRRLPAPRAITVAPNRALVVDSFSGNLIGIDLETGDREIISGVLSSGSADNGPTSLREASDVAFDPRGNRALVSVSRPEAIVAVDLTTRRRTLLSGAGTGSGPEFRSIEGIVVDAPRDRALVTDLT